SDLRLGQWLVRVRPWNRRHRLTSFTHERLGASRAGNIWRRRRASHREARRVTTNRASADDRVDDAKEVLAEDLLHIVVVVAASEEELGDARDRRDVFEPFGRAG